MKKIIELAEKYICTKLSTEVPPEVQRVQVFETFKELRQALIKRKQLEQTPITEEWLKEHGWEKNKWQDAWHLRVDDRTVISYERSGGEPSGLMWILKNEYTEDEVQYELPEPYSVANLYDACELCGIYID